MLPQAGLDLLGRKRIFVYLCILCGDIGHSCINNILPQCIQQWQRSPCIANEHGKKMLEHIHHEQQDTYTCLKDTECHFHELEAIILHGKQTTWLFRDAYSLKSKRYCKRLKVLCSEHSWDPKVPKDEVGGCPLVHNVFEFTGNFCCLPKCLCNCYYSWEKLRRAEVDLERMQAVHIQKENCASEAVLNG
ncbi:PREDICTED: CXXC-type zinc finger protein 1-like [Rhinopithecus bieti]|uniref:CXXC-type zinc finger protein 1-like n=1 Tax=Rhinopithecus bieti TaxID=61621 RepID=UPI00083C5301|nr:PREDICTED: CXXC-type zinc finger protein 1-like [Rhinopithecus bieti]